jgi:hypothetical protein
MAFAARVARGGLSPLAVQALLQDRALTVSAAGATQATATALAAAFNVVTTCVLGADGVLISSSAEPGDDVTVSNATSVTLYAYPPSGGAINGGTTNAPVAIAPNRAAIFKYVTTTTLAAFF